MQRQIFTKANGSVGVANLEAPPWRANAVQRTEGHLLLSVVMPSRRGGVIGKIDAMSAEMNEPATSDEFEKASIRGTGGRGARHRVYAGTVPTRRIGQRIAVGEPASWPRLPNGKPRVALRVVAWPFGRRRELERTRATE